MRLTTPALGLVVATAALGLTACGGPETPYTDTDLAVAALASAMAPQLPADQAHCTAKSLVDAQGVDALTRAGALTKDHVAKLTDPFDKATATALADATIACWDWRKNTESWASRYPTAEPKAWDKYVACASKLDDKLHAALEASYDKAGTAKPAAALAKAQDACKKVLGTPVG
ncbi:hypothetical protein [Nocardioides jejuensis]|uniref:Uncharacterized protein n=1 Tax=Nocardioides jejuensis TaxID=2502782 RepID=A0A4R1CDX7_9ACTN|nr:hypothetical protein [Nocardioides jejuensis]TCJ28278.1 hypothetical protein EPD65_08005 [Nocardioides jejuensis]